MRHPAPRPTDRGIAVAMALVGIVAVAIATGTPELAPLTVVMAVPLACSPVIAYRRAARWWDGTEFHAHMEPTTTGVGGAMQWMLSVTDRASGPALPPIGAPGLHSAWRVRRVTEDNPDRRRFRAPSAQSSVALATPRPRMTRTTGVPVPTGRRGVIELPLLTTWAHDAFGLCGAPGPALPPAVGVVHPVPIAFDLTLPASPTGGSGAGSSPDVAGADVGDLEGIRPYVAGDRLSLLHWPARARYGTWYVRQFSTEGTRGIPVVLDDRSGVHRKADFEHLASTALWLLDATLRDGRVVRLSTLSGAHHVLEPTGAGRARLRLLLAEFQPVAGRTPTRAASTPVGCIVLTTPAGAERLTRGLRALVPGRSPHG